MKSSGAQRLQKSFVSQDSHPLVSVSLVSIDHFIYLQPVFFFSLVGLSSSGLTENFTFNIYHFLFLWG